MRPDVALHPVDAELDRLGAIAAHEHRLAVGAARKTLEHALACGDALLSARELLVDGQWRPWLRENVSMDVSTAKMYSRLATFRQDLRAAGIESIQGARDYVREHGLTLEAFATKGHPEPVVIEIRRLVAGGMSHRAIARQVGVSRSNVGAIARGERHASKPPPSVSGRNGHPEISDDMIERAAHWLADHFGLGRVTDRVREDALSLLGAVLGG